MAAFLDTMILPASKNLMDDGYYSQTTHQLLSSGRTVSNIICARFFDLPSRGRWRLWLLILNEKT